jgi:FdrA protein
VIPIVRCAVRQGAYHDSVVLMRLQAALAALPGVVDAGVVMATPANRDILSAAGLLPPPGVLDAAGPDDLLVVVKALDEGTADAALARVDALLAERRSTDTSDYRPRSLSAALKELPDARWVLLSIPGRQAAGAAHDALDQGRNVFLFSDNVSLADEVALKTKARARGLLVLGPDCGTATIGGAGFGFANRVRRGAIGLVAASGTGLQAVASRVHELGAGISQALGTGGRDLKREVGGITALQALDLLDRDPETKVIVLLGKPPEPEIAVRLLARARAATKPVVVNFLGAPLPTRRLANLHFAATLAEAADLAVALLDQEATVPRPAGDREDGAELSEPKASLLSTARSGLPPAPHHSPPGGGALLRALFAGGTLAGEALVALSAILGPIATNLTGLPGARPIPAASERQGHLLLDLGADEFTVGRLHPMIDQDLRLRRLRQEAADPAVAVLLLDVVLGDGAHPDPASELAPVIASARDEARAAGRDLAVVVLVIGTDEDPQNLGDQIDKLTGAGAHVVRMVDDAVAAVLTLLPSDAPQEPAGPPVPLAAVAGPPAAVNLGLESFHQSLLAQGARSIQVDWRPPAGGDERLAGLLSRMKKRTP